MYIAKAHITGSETYAKGDKINEKDPRIDIKSLLERGLLEKKGGGKSDEEKEAEKAEKAAKKEQEEADKAQEELNKANDKK